jgi:excisionase family DNA binding protein
MEHARFITIFRPGVPKACAASRIRYFVVEDERHMDELARDDFERLWDANDVAAYLHVSRSWVYHRAESGELPYLRVGGLLRFEREAILAFARGEPVPPKRLRAR